MRLLSATFMNFCQHADRTVEFHPGLNCIRGPNGAGKSNLLDGLKGALTGVFSAAAGGRPANITFGRSGPSGVHVAFEHRGESCQVGRGLRPVSHCLNVGGQVWTKATDVGRELEELLGVSTQVLLDYVFVDQGRLSSFLSDRDADRLDSLHQLFGLDRADRIWKAIGDFSVPASPGAVDLDAIKARLATNEATLADLDAKLGEAPAPAADPVGEAAACQRVVDRYREGDRCLTDATREAGHVARLTAAVTADIANAERANDAETAAVAAHAAALEAAAETQAAMAAWVQYGTAVAAVRAAEKERQDLLTQLGSHQPANPPVEYLPDTDQWRATMAEATAAVDRWTRYLNAFDVPGGCGNCPTCGTAVSALPVSVNDAREARRRATEDGHRFHEMWRISRQFDAIETRKSTVRRELAVRLTALPPVPALPDPPAISEAECQRRHRAVTATAATAKAATARANEMRLRRAETEKALTEAMAAEVRMRQAAADMPTAAEATAAERRAKKLTADYLWRTKAEADAASLRGLVVADREAVVRNAPLARKAAATSRLRDHLASVRDVFHRTRLPTVVAQRRMAELRVDLNLMLRELDADFAVDVDDELRFVATMRTGAVQPAYRLSWGQKAILAIAFRVVVNTRYAGDLGLLCLDEPTAGLDEKNVQCLSPALARLRQLSSGRGLQVLFVTHEKAIDHLFDRVITLPPPEASEIFSS